jgi:2-phospho-L-lactate guanylyltransferase (CobY/MobA/RfbA family)
MLTAVEVTSMLAAGEAVPAPTVVLAPDRSARGTNLLLLRPPGALPFAFGEGSLARHRALAHAGGIEPAIFEATGTSFDVDTPTDLDEVRRRGLWTPEDALCGESVRGEAR